jgi:bleomycin hydrolase
MEKINLNDIIDWESDFLDNSINKVIQNTVSSNNLEKVSLNRDKLKNLNYVYSKRINPIMNATEQNKSGRCWIFALMNAIRYKLAEKYKLPNDFELSQGYLFFYDKLERSNYFLHTILHLKNNNHIELNRILHYITSNCSSDGGQYDMLRALIQKYGIVPKKEFNESFHTSNSNDMNNVLKKVLRYYAMKIWTSDESSETAIIDKAIKKIYQLLLKFFGNPPIKFNWSFYDKQNNYQTINDLTPLSFYNEYIKPLYDINNHISIINDPRQNHPYHQSYVIEFLGNIVGAEVRHLNLPIDRLKELVKKSIDNNEAVWFGCDYGKDTSKPNSIMDTDIIQKNELLDITDIEMTKEEQIQWNESMMNHAMLFVGYSSNNNELIFEVENSHGKKINKGYLKMSEKWFNQYMYQIAIDKKYLTENEIQAYHNTPIILPIYDSFGTLAI